jgi:hypothetical protein
LEFRAGEEARRALRKGWELLGRRGEVFRHGRFKYDKSGYQYKSGIEKGGGQTTLGVLSARASRRVVLFLSWNVAATIDG